MCPDQRSPVALSNPGDLLVLDRINREDDRDVGAGQPASYGDVIGDLPDQPQPVAVLSEPQPLIKRPGSEVGRPAGVADLAMQPPPVCPLAYPPVACAVTYNIGGQLMNGYDRVADPVGSESGCGRMCCHCRTQRTQRVHVELLI
jgi:hypothetical protein